MALTAVNLTGHPLRLISESGQEVTLAASGRARVSAMNQVQEYVVIDGAKIPIVEVRERTMFDLPPPEEGVIYVVSGLVAATAKRLDVVSPARLKRTADGAVKGARALMRHT